jgi:hypothetical protein
MIRFLPALLLLLSGPALAEDILIESEPYIVRGDAVLLHSEIVEAFPEDSTATVRLVRRFHQGQGWRYLVVIEGAESPEEAAALAALVGGLEVILPEALVEEVSQPEPVEVVVEPEAPAEERLMPAEGVLRAAVRAHGGGEGAGILIEQAESIRFSYTRTVPEGDGQLVATNHFLRSGDALRLEVEIGSGTAVDSTTILTTDRVGWVTVDGVNTERDPGRTLEILERFSPGAVLAVPLGFPEDVATASVWRVLETVERIGDGDEALWVLRGEEDSGLQEAAFGVRDRLLRQVTWTASQGDITFTYDDYQSLEKDLIVPFHTRIERDGELIEEITVLTFEVNPVLADGLFSAPQ